MAAAAQVIGLDMTSPIRNDDPMGIVRRGIGSLLVVGVLTLLPGAVPASAADSIVADTECCTFAPGPYFQDLGEIPLFVNPVDANPHNVTSTSKGPDGDALFRSQTVGADSTTPVAGTQYLNAGTYPFFCTLHGSGMSGELVVEGDTGAVVARPSITVSIPAQSLGKVRKSGRIKVRVKANTTGRGIRIGARKGSKAITSSPKLSLAAGASRIVNLKLSPAGRKAMAKGRQVAISAVGTVAFGKPSSAKRNLR